MEYYESGSLTKLMGRIQFGSYDGMELLRQGLTALEWLHGLETPIVHRDIKPCNILIKSETPLVIRLTDFGLAKQSKSLNSLVGTPRYLAPELHSQDPYTALVDIWSLGVVALECLDRASFQGAFKTHQSQKRHERRKKPWECLVEAMNWSLEKNPLLKGRTKRVIKFVMDHMVRINPNERFSAAECLDMLLNQFYPNHDGGDDNDGGDDDDDDDGPPGLEKSPSADRGTAHGELIDEPKSPMEPGTVRW